MKILIIGASGFLGQIMMGYFKEQEDIEVVGTYASKEQEGLLKLDATNKEEVKKIISEQNPDLVVSTVALTSSTACENDPELCRKLNFETAKNISEITQEKEIAMAFISSCYIFDGKKGNYSEEDKPNPLNAYGREKVKAEKAVLENKKGMVIRVDIMYGYNGIGKGNGVFDMILNEKPVELREPNQIRQPVFVWDVPRIILELCKKEQFGIFGLAGKEKIKMIDFLQGLEETLPVKREKSRISKAENVKGPSVIKIPGDCSLDTSKLEKLGIITTSFEEGTQKLQELLRNK